MSLLKGKGVFLLRRLMGTALCGAVVLVVGGCIPLALMAGAGAVVVVGTQDRGVSGFVSDQTISAKIRYAFVDKGNNLFASVDVGAHGGVVLLTGTVGRTQEKKEAARLAWSVVGVKAVHNHIESRDTQAIHYGAFFNDAWITTRLKTALLMEGKIHSRNYTIITAKHVVYLLGVGQDQKEVTRVLELAKTIPGVRQVISYVQIKTL